ncbi:ly6/PLAUR domain-containing protein 2-like [Hypanus sabinus]|uniref:ly6/PLAUR domain-containing protein 2-like n=1 Tax=Hypanus sabinus TaxID=79690 RepID=UPI0028C39DF7|nr:ly6/PLAUR domain-containing protein 2-like [Hypanus sabinus]
MKFITGAFIVLLSSLNAEALRCYHCSNARVMMDCNSSQQQCPVNKTMCLTSVKTIGFSQQGLGYVTVSKKCSFRIECDADASNLVIGGIKVICCSTDLCNTSGLNWNAQRKPTQSDKEEVTESGLLVL